MRWRTTHRTHSAGFRTLLPPLSNAFQAKHMIAVRQNSKSSLERKLLLHYNVVANFTSLMRGFLNAIVSFVVCYCGCRNRHCNNIFNFKIMVKLYTMIFMTNFALHFTSNEISVVSSSTVKRLLISTKHGQNVKMSSVNVYFNMMHLTKVRWKTSNMLSQDCSNISIPNYVLLSHTNILRNV